MKIFDIALKDLKRSFRSLFAIGMTFAAPLLITGLIYMAFGGMGSGNTELPVTKVVVVNQDTPPAGSPDFGGMIIDMFRDPSVSKWLQASEITDEAEAQDMVNQQKAGVAMIIPQGFSNAMLTGEGQSDVRLIQDPTLTIGPMVIKDMIGSLIDGTTGARIAIQAEAEQRQTLGLAPDPGAQANLLQSYQQWFTEFQRNLYHSPQAALIATPPNLSEGPSANQSGDLSQIMSFVLAGMMIFFGFYTGAYSMMSILREEEEGTLARMFTTPTDRTLILGGKFLAVLLMVTVQALVMLVVGAFAFHIDWGQPATIALVLAGHVVTVTGLGVLLISLVKTSKQAGPVLGGALTGLGMLGGLFTVSVPNMPKIFDTLGLFTPQGWVLKAWKACLEGSSPANVMTTLIVLLALGTVLFLAGSAIFRRRFA
jgi:ABC-2 type transport system permease protein